MSRQAAHGNGRLEQPKQMPNSLKSALNWSATSPWGILALHWLSFMNQQRKESTVLKALKKMFGKADTEASRDTPLTAPVVPPPPPPSKASRSAQSAPKRKVQKTGGEPQKSPSAAWKPEDFTVEPAEGKVRFHDFKLAKELMHAIHDLGFPYCTPIQAGVLGHTLKGQDAIGRAQTGTGKTAAFLISTITQLLQTPAPKERYMGEPRALIIAPTRELVVQIAKDAQQLSKYTPLNVMSFVGGMDFDKQLKQLESRFCDILVATPGRLLDFNQRGEVHLDMVEVMVLDEADRMLDMGFIPQVRQIIRQTPMKSERQTLLFSATFTEDVMNLAKQWTLDPAIVEIEPENVASDTVEQHVYAVASADKYRLLYNLVSQNDWNRVMVFANRKDEVRRIEERLTRDGISAAQMSGDVPQHKRIKVLEGFRAGHIRVLVATDVAGRGIHVDAISHVINFTLPEDPDDYVLNPGFQRAQDTPCGLVSLQRRANRCATIQKTGRAKDQTPRRVKSDRLLAGR
jgi:ATP-dependent RNA helicase RhlB